MAEDRLEGLLWELVVQAAKTLEGVSEGDLPTIRGYRIERFAQGRRRLAAADVPNWHRLITLLSPRLGELSSLSAAIAAAAQDRRLRGLLGKQVRGLGHGGRWGATALPVEFLLDYFVTSRTFESSRTHFRGRYREMLRFFDPTASFRMRWIAPLSGFNSSQQSISLGDSRIRRVSFEEVAEIAEDGNIGLHYGGRFWFQFVLEGEVDTPKLVLGEEDSLGTIDSANQPFADAGRINREIILLRCFASATATSPTFVYRYRGWPASFFLGGALIELPWNLRMDQLFLHLGPSLTRSQIRSYRLLRERFLEVAPRSGGVLDAAARRIALAAEQPYAGDQVADYVSATEGMLVPDRGPEIAYRFRERVAFLLGGRSRRKDIAQMAGDLYKLRSKVVHGEVLPDKFGYGTILGVSGRRRRGKQSPNVGRAAQQARSLATSVLKALIRRGGPIKDWDEVIFRS